MPEPKLHVAYLRLSMEDGDVASGKSDESQSIASQRACIRQYLRTHEDLPLHFEEIIDDGYSGTNFHRPGIQRMLQLVEADKIATVIVRDLSRFARNFLEAGYYLEFVFPARGVRFISVNDGYDSAEYGESTAGLQIAVKNLVNQMYSQDISQKIKSAVDLKKRNGEYVYGTAPYGYKKGPQKNTIVTDEEAARVVQRIFAMACDGQTITQICRRLNEEKIPTPSVYLAAVRGKYPTRAFWTYDSVRNILGNRIYTGDTEPFKSHVVKVGSKRVKSIPEAERVVLPDTHEALISRETFFRAREVVKSNVKTPSKGAASVLSSFLVCGCCGNKLTKGKRQNKTFLCASARYDPSSDCKKVRCEEEKMKAILLNAIRQQCRLADEQVKLIRSAAKARQSEADSLTVGLRHHRRALESAQNAKMALYEEFIGGKLDREAYLKKKSTLNEKEQTAKLQLALLEERRNALAQAQEQNDAVQEEQDVLSKYQDISELDEKLMRELVKNVIIFPNGHVEIVWNFNDFIGKTNGSNQQKF